MGVPGRHASSSGHTGLYHVAIRYPDRATLAIALRRLVDAGMQLDGASDHGVTRRCTSATPTATVSSSTATAPRRSGRATRTASLGMFTAPLDVRALLAEAE